MSDIFVNVIVRYNFWMSHENHENKLANVTNDYKVKSKKFIEKNCDWKILIIIKTTGICTLNVYN